MKKTENVIVRVYLDSIYWETGVLNPYFEDFRYEEHKTMYFRSDNVDYDADSRCYIFRLTQLGDPPIRRDVHIPERFVLGIAIRDGEEPREDMQTIGFVPPRKG